MKPGRDRIECGGGLYIRTITEKDTFDVLRWRNSEPIKKYFIQQQDISEDDHKKWLEKVRCGDVCQFIICREDGTGIGSVYLQHIEREHAKAEYGVFIGDTDSCGRGYGTMVARAVLQLAFYELKLNRVYLRVLPWNARAVRCYEHAGFRREGILRQSVCVSGKYCDILIMGVLREDFVTESCIDPKSCYN